MKKAVVLFCIIAICLPANLVFAQDEGKFGVGIKVSHLYISDDDIRNINLGFDGTARYGANISYFFFKYFSLELSAEYSKNDVTEYLSGADNNFGELEQIPILLNARLHPPVNIIVKPYIGLGGGYYINNLDFNDSSSSIFLPGTNVEFENTWGMHINGGLKVDLTENITLDIDFRYGWSNPDVIIYRSGSEERTDIDIRDFVGGIGLTYYF